MAEFLPVQPNNDLTNVRLKSSMFGNMARAVGRVAYRAGRFLGSSPWEPTQRSKVAVNPDGTEIQLTDQQRYKARILGEKIYHQFVAGRFNFLSQDDGKSDETPEMKREYWKFAITEPALDAALWIKIHSVVQNELIINPASKSPYDRRYAEWVHDCIKRSRGGMRNLGEQILYHGLVHGNVLCEPKMAHEHRRNYADLFPYGYWTLRDFVAKDPNDYRVEVDGFRNVIGVWSSKSNEWWDPSYFVTWANRPVYGNPAGTSGVRSARRACKLIKLAHNFRGIYLEQFGLPMMVAKYPKEDDDSARIANAAIQHARSLGYILIPDGVDISALAIATRGETEYQDAIDDYRKEIFLSQTGSYLYAMEGSVGHAAGNSETHRSTLDLAVWYLSEILEEMLNHQIIPMLMNVNVYQAELPTASLGSVNDGDLKASTDIDRFLINDCGLELDAEELYERYHRSAPKEQSKVVSLATVAKMRPQLAQQPGPGGPPLAGLLGSNAFAQGKEDFQQTVGWTCGCECFRFAMSAQGVTPPSEFDAAFLLGSDPSKGTNPGAIERVLRESGLQAEGRRGMTMPDVARYLSEGAVLITPIQSGPAPEQRMLADREGHYVVITRLDLPNGMVEYFDPASGSDDPVWESVFTFVNDWHDREADGTPSTRYAIVVPKKKETLSFSSNDKSSHGQVAYMYIATNPDVDAAVSAVGKMVDPADLHEKGVASNPHVTVLYGLGDENYYAAARVCEGVAPFRLTLGGLTVLQPPDKPYDVLAFRCYSEKLERLNYALASTLDVEQDYDQFLPHITVAYLRRNAGAKYAAPEHEAFGYAVGESFPVESVVFKRTDGIERSVALGMVPTIPIMG